MVPTIGFGRGVAGVRGLSELDEDGLERCDRLTGVGPLERLRNRSCALACGSPSRDRGLGGKAMSLPSEPDPFSGVVDGVEARDEEAEW